MARKVIVSFKNNTEDDKLFNEIIGHSDKSAYIKDKLRGILMHEKSGGINTPTKENVNRSEIMDILE